MTRTQSAVICAEKDEDHKEILVITPLTCWFLPNFSFFISDAHYYLNLDRCAYGGIRLVGSPLDGKEMVRGAEIVAVNHNCSTVYYHAEYWTPYLSGRDIVCTAHPLRKEWERTLFLCVYGKHAISFIRRLPKTTIQRWTLETPGYFHAVTFFNAHATFSVFFFPLTLRDSAHQSGNQECIL